LREQITEIGASAADLDTRYDGRVADLQTALTTLITIEVERLDAEITRIIGKDLTEAESLARDLKKIREDIESLYWTRTLNGSNNVQAVLNIYSSGSLIENNVIALKFTGGGQSVTANPDGSVTISIPGGGSTTWYQGEQLTLAGDNKTFTLKNAPTSVLFVWGGHQPQIYGVDFTGTINGSNKTFVYTNAQDPSILSDQYATYS